jgi:HK97 family phage major capsid protein
MSESAKVLAATLEEKRAALANVFNSIKTEDGGYDRSANPQVIDEIRKRHDELADLGKKYDEAVDLESKASENDEALAGLRSVNRLPFPAKPATKGMTEPDTLDLGDEIYKSFVGKDGRFTKGSREIAKLSPIDFKTTFTRAAGFAPESLRSGKVQLSAQRPIMVPDVVPMIQTTQAAYKYMSETTFTNNAAGLAENDGTGAAESAIAYTEQSVTLERIATFIPVTEEQLDDAPGIQGLLNGRLTYMVQSKLETDMMAANGSTPNISGFYTQVTQSQAKGTDPVFDAIFKAMTKIRHTGFANPTAVVIHPNDWQDVRLTRTADGIYILGNPADPGPERLWGVQAVITTAATENTALVGDFTGHSALVYRQGVRVVVSTEHSDYFRKFLLAVRVDLRAALVVYRILAFCEVTGL